MNTHCEIHPSMIFGVMGHQLFLPEHNQLPRNLFACGQVNKQYHYIIVILIIELIKWVFFKLWRNTNLKNRII